MAPGIRSIEYEVPSTVLRQSDVRDLFRSQPGASRLAQRLITAAFDGSEIETRHTVVAELAGEARDEPLFVDDGVLLNPLTGARNDVYAREAPALLTAAARRALAASGFAAEQVTHVVTVSCTGFVAPGPDYTLVRELGLRPETERYHLGFMGCYGAFPALRAAKQFCEADENAVVLVACVELCSIHVQRSDDPDQIVASSVFADGAAAGVVSAHPAGDREGDPALTLDTLLTTLTDDGESEMAWTIADHGFEMVLSSYVPQIIERSIVGALEPLLGAAGGVGSVRHWAVHPGGRSILDRVQSTLALSDEQMEPSRQVLRDFGNMSSVTVLLILRRLLAEAADGDHVCAMAFGPGLTVESALMTKTSG